MAIQIANGFEFESHLNDVTFSINICPAFPRGESAFMFENSHELTPSHSYLNGSHFHHVFPQPFTVRIGTFVLDLR